MKREGIAAFGADAQKGNLNFLSFGRKHVENVV
jgi:hypothetical protein